MKKRISRRLSMELLFRGFGYGVNTPFMPGVAAGESSDREPQPPGGAVFLHRFHCIRGTGRIETAMLADKRAQYSLIDPDQKDY